MNRFFTIFGFLLSVAVLVSVGAVDIPLQQCPGYNFDKFNERISIRPCGEKLCELPKEQNITVAFKFLPERKVKKLTNRVSATIAGVTLPFIGTDLTSACDNVFNAEDNTSAPCPLAPGKEYVYHNVIYTQSIYLETDLIVNWSLDDQHEKSVICFKVPARIVKKKSKKNKRVKAAASS